MTSENTPDAVARGVGKQVGRPAFRPDQEVAEASMPLAHALTEGLTENQREILIESAFSGQYKAAEILGISQQRCSQICCQNRAAYDGLVKIREHLCAMKAREGLWAGIKKATDFLQSADSTPATFKDASFLMSATTQLANVKEKCTSEAKDNGLNESLQKQLAARPAAPPPKELAE